MIRFCFELETIRDAQDQDTSLRLHTLNETSSSLAADKTRPAHLEKVEQWKQVLSKSDDWFERLLAMGSYR